MVLLLLTLLLIQMILQKVHNLYYTNARFDTQLGTKTTDNLTEGSSNLYFTNARSRSAISVASGSGLAYNSSTGEIDTSAIPNTQLANSSITVTDGSNSTATALGGTITFSGTSNEVEVAESSGTITIGLPSDTTIGNDLTVTNDLTVSGNTAITGNLTVNGTTTTVNSTTVTVMIQSLQ